MTTRPTLLIYRFQKRLLFQTLHCKYVCTYYALQAIKCEKLHYTNITQFIFLSSFSILQNETCNYSLKDNISGNQTYVYFLYKTRGGGTQTQLYFIIYVSYLNNSQSKQIII